MYISRDVFNESWQIDSDQFNLQRVDGGAYLNRNSYILTWAELLRWGSAHDVRFEKPGAFCVYVNGKRCKNRCNSQIDEFYILFENVHPVSTSIYTSISIDSIEMTCAVQAREK